VNKLLIHIYPRDTLVAVTGLLLLCVNTLTIASTVQLSLLDHKDKPLHNAVVTFKPLNNETSSIKTEPVSIAQVNKEFVPEVSVVRVGTAINFPNQDSISHHVYSFSKAKTFDLPLYQGTPSEPVIFDTPGLVTLGCNIHDWMRAYVVVVDTPYYKISDANGDVSLGDIPDGDYRLEVWHPRQRKLYSQAVTINAQFAREIKIRVKPQFRSRRHSSGRSNGYDR